MRFLLILLVLSTKCFSQSDSDSLRKYSYFILGLKQKDSVSHFHQGTGYFIKDKNRIIFITAKHILIGRDLDCNKYANYPDTMTIYLMNGDGDFLNKYLTFRISEIKDTVICGYELKDADLISYDFTNQITEEVNSIEGFITDLPKKHENICIFGFPAYANRHNGDYVLKPHTQIIFDSYKLYNFFDYGNQIDSINYEVAVDNFKKSNFDSLQGYSGAPVFLKNANTNKWHFIGTFVAGIQNNKHLLICKPIFTVNEINKYKN